MIYIPLLIKNNAFQNSIAAQTDHSAFPLQPPIKWEHFFRDNLALSLSGISSHEFTQT